MKTHLLLFLTLLFGAVSGSYAQCDVVDLALGHPTVASSIETIGFPASGAVDADTTGTRWSSLYTDAQWIYVDLGSVFNLCQVKLYWEAALGKNFTIEISNDALSWTTAATVTGNTSYQNTLPISGFGRYVRVNGTLRGSGWGYSLYAFKVYGMPGNTGTANIALGQPATASATLVGSAANVFDGNPSTYWQTNIGNGYSLTVDLGSVQTVGTVALSFGSNYAVSYGIYLSNDNITWTNTVTVYNNSALQIAVNAVGVGRYVRFVGLASYLALGYAIKEMTVTGMNIVLPVEFTRFTAQKQGRGVLLDWAAVLPSPGSFSVERSVNGGALVTLGSMPAASGDNGGFQWVDDAAGLGTNAYRVKETDADGKSIYSSVATVNFDDASSAGLYLYPNPTKDYVIVGNSGGVLVRTVSLFSVEGRRCFSVSSVSTGPVRIPLSGLPAGIYWVSVETDAGNKTLRLVTR
jgi:hypothetical protein